MKRFVIVVDTQGDFIRPDGALAVAGADSLAAPMQQWLAALDPAETVGVLFTFDTHYVETYYDMPESKEFPIHCVRGTPGWDNLLDWQAIDAAIPVWRLEKGVFDMWAEAGLAMTPMREGAPVDRDAFFTGLRSDGVETVSVIGVAADYCVKWAVDGLVARGFAVTVPPTLTRGIHRQIDAVLTDDFAGRRVSASLG